MNLNALLWRTIAQCGRCTGNTSTKKLCALHLLKKEEAQTTFHFVVSIVRRFQRQYNVSASTSSEPEAYLFVLFLHKYTAVLHLARYGEEKPEYKMILRL